MYMRNFPSRDETRPDQTNMDKGTQEGTITNKTWVDLLSPHSHLSHHHHIFSFFFLPTPSSVDGPVWAS
jgi:hypothetical protein